MFRKLTINSVGGEKELSRLAYLPIAAVHLPTSNARAFGEVHPVIFQIDAQNSIETHDSRV